MASVFDDPPQPLVDLRRVALIQRKQAPIGSHYTANRRLNFRWVRYLLLGNPKAPVAAETLFCIVDPFRPTGLTHEVRLGLNRPAIQVSTTLRLPDLLKDIASLVLVVALLATMTARLYGFIPRCHLARPTMNPPSTCG